jgi:hypothetical protein
MFNWFKTIENVGEALKINFEQVQQINIIDFLTMIEYVAWKNKEFEKSLK